MQTVSVGELKTRFSEVLEWVTRGEEVIISFGKKRQKVAALLPYSRYNPKSERKLGLLKGRGTCVIRKGFSLTDEEVLLS